jgi:sodium borate transporter 11
MKEKGTKNFLETGRTFATIFADIELRAKLLKAATQQEIISIIDVNQMIVMFFR